MHPDRLVFTAAMLAMATLSFGRSASADWRMLPPSGCIPVNYAVLGSDGIARFQGTSSFFINEGQDLASLANASMYASGTRSSVVCPVHDTSQMMAAGFNHVNVHFTDQSSAFSVRAYLITKFATSLGFNAVRIGTNSPASNVCTSGPNCFFRGNFTIPNDGDFRSIAVMLPPNSELHGLFFSN